MLERTKEFSGCVAVMMETRTQTQNSQQLVSFKMQQQIIQILIVICCFSLVVVSTKIDIPTQSVTFLHDGKRGEYMQQNRVFLFQSDLSQFKSCIHILITATDVLSNIFDIIAYVFIIILNIIFSNNYIIKAYVMLLLLLTLLLSGHRCVTNQMVFIHI